AALAEQAYRVAEHAAGRIARQAYGQAGIVNACAMAIEPMKLVVIDTPDVPRLIPVANRNPDPRRVDIMLAVGTKANQPLLPGNVMPPTDRPGAYLCTGQVCLPPVTDPHELDALLRRR
ncbi:MAG: thioredoxin domain-containing protein, partial [Mesorhizobium sp.]